MCEAGNRVEEVQPAKSRKSGHKVLLSMVAEALSTLSVGTEFPGLEKSVSKVNEVLHEAQILPPV
jgi:hypothetical protein